MLKGDFDRYAESIKAKKGTSEVDEHFLAQIEGWRLELARNLALRNPRLTQRELNFAVQRIIDRIIFLRVCEGRGLEDERLLGALMNGGRIYRRLCELFEAADARYNSGLFHFRPEPGRREPPDDLTLGLEVDDKLLRDIFASLYYPDCSYAFSHLPADILGQAYEQFLGKVIRLTEGHHAVVDDKPEVKKAGGVYYTPTYIVDYIVRETVGRLVQGKTPRQVRELKIVDPACGSGSFLIGAYQFLLNWHRDWYHDHDPAKWAKGANPALVQSAGGGWKLATEERKRILINNIYGVDIDSQAVEVTKLSLLLKVLEDETSESLQTVFRLFRQRALPDLGDNIKCGNSLIGPDFYQQAELPLLTDEERYRINVFDWQAEFPRVFPPKTASSELRETATAVLSDYTMPGVPLHGAYARRERSATKAATQPGPPEPEWEGGFDAVIGNPPYVRIQGFPKPDIAYLTSHYWSATGNCDLYVSFIERGFALLNRSGVLGMIAPNKFFRTDYGEGLRRLLSRKRAVSRIVDFGASQVFTATTYTCLLFLEKAGRDRFDYGESHAGPECLRRAVFSSRPATTLSSAPWAFASGGAASLPAKLQSAATPLLQLPAEMSRGSSTGDDEIFLFEPGTLDIEDEVVREPLFASDFGRYTFAPEGKWKIIFPYVREGGRYRLYQEHEFKSKCPRAFTYLHDHRAALKRRKQYREWFGYSAPRNLEVHDRAQMVVPLLANRGLFSMIADAHRGRFCPMASGGFTIALAKDNRLRPEYILGLLNSRLLFWRLRTLSNLFRGGWVTCTKQYFGDLPIRNINFANPADKSQHDRLVNLVEHMLTLHRQKAAARTPQEKIALERQISATDTIIDRLVYDLYGLTDKEIKIVEEHT